MDANDILPGNSSLYVFFVSMLYMLFYKTSFFVITVYYTLLDGGSLPMLSIILFPSSLAIDRTKNKFITRQFTTSARNVLQNKYRMNKMNDLNKPRHIEIFSKSY